MLFSTKYILAIIITLLLVAGLYFVLRKNAQDSKNIADRRHYRTLEKDTAYSSPNTQGIYGLISSRGSLLALTKNRGVLIDSNLRQESTILDQNPNGRFSYYSAQRHDTASFDAKAGILRVSFFGISREYKINSATRNAIYLSPYFYFDYVSTDSEGNQTVEIRSWEGFTGQVRTVAHLDYLFHSYIDPEQACLASQLKGNFFAVDKQTWGYVFNRGSFLLIGDREKTQIHNSIFDKGFVKYKSNPIEKGDATDLLCHAENEAGYYYDGGFHEGKIYALSGVANKPGHADIDVYDAETFRYLYTLTTRLKAQNSYAHIMEFAGNSLYLYSNDGEVIKFSKF